ncbi:MAG: putative NTPase family [Frankiales bacterium]|nr:putative NTPase family [Frankiales bacterium]
MAAVSAMSVAKTAVTVLRWGHKRMTAPVEPLLLNLPEMTTAIEASSSEGAPDVLVLDQEHARQIEEFLEDPTVVAMLRIACVQELLPAEDRHALESFSGLTEFRQLAALWCERRGQSWHGLADVLWLAVRDQQQLVLHQVKGRTDLPPGTPDSIDVADTLAQAFFFGRLAVKGEPEYLRLIRNVIDNSSRQDLIAQLLAEHDRVGRGDSDRTVFLIQGLEDEKARFDQLYIDRWLSDARSGAPVSAEIELDLSQARPRVVIIGDPGVGKSTLTGWLRWRLGKAAGEGPTPIPITLVARLVLTNPESTLIGAITDQLTRDTQLPVDADLVAELLACGWVALIVDGIDEVLNTQQRRAVVKQLEVLAERFPFVSIVCTTRRTGFEVALFNGRLFQTLNLEEYGEAQVREYATKWFEPRGGRDKAERFIGESRTLDDLRRNPLMLALLCTLFRQYDYIPRSRRDVYLRCAALMFHEWDPRRGIQIPNLFKNEGEAILRDIALLFHQSGGVGQRLEEGQLVALIAGYLRDRGQDPMQAAAAARELLDHCSNRAWILSKFGAEGGVPQFAFTHRTFFEFFAAEGIIRRLNRENQFGQSVAPTSGMGSVAAAVLSAYEEDSTSVMPELLLQAADDLMGGVSTAVLTDLKNQALYGLVHKREGYTALAVRLIAAAGVNVDVAESVFRAMFEQWVGGGRTPTVAGFAPVLDVSAGHRTRLLALMRDRPEYGLEYLRRFARLELIGEAGLYSEEWRQAAQEIAASIDARVDLSVDAALVTYLVSSRVLDLYDGLSWVDRGRDLLLLNVEGHFVPGLLWRSLIAPSYARLDSAVTGWREAKRRLLRDQHLSSDDPRMFPVAQSIPGFDRPVPEFPFDLGVALGLLVGEEGDQFLADRLQLSSLAELLPALRHLRKNLEFDSHGGLRSAATIDSLRPEANDRINALFRKADQRCPLWLKDWVGTRETKRSAISWT